MTRRVTTAREQHEMLAPWRTASDSRWIEKDEQGETVRYPEATQRVIDDVHAATGVRLDVENTGGNTYVLSGRCHEDGSWLVVGDAEDGCIHWDLAHRHREEAEEGPKGWYAAVYHNQVEHDPETGKTFEYWGFDPEEGHSVEPYHLHADDGATVHDLPGVVRETLATMPRGQMPTGPVAPGHDDPGDDYGDIFGKQSMRRSAFDWKNEKWDGPAGEDFPEGYHRSKTENGHHLNVYRVRRPDGWAWSIYAPHPDSENSITMVEGAGHRYGEEMPSAEHAMRQAEEAYKRLFPIGTDTGTHDSGVDYSDLNKFMEGM